MASGPSDLVADTKIRVEFDSDLTYRFTIQSGISLRRRERKETWILDRKLGQGNYGSVWLHRSQTNNQDEVQAVKRIDKAKMLRERVDWHKELEAIAKFSQKKYAGLFVNFLGWYESDNFVFIAMEYIEHGNLESHLTGPLPETEAREITHQVAEGLRDLHANNFAHRDLKPANLMVVRKGPEWWVKIGDFGISKRVHEDTCLKTTVGSRLFMAPEAQLIYPPDIDPELIFHYTERVDIWSLGIVVYYMLFHAYPFTSENKFLVPYVRGTPLPFPSPETPVTTEAYEFIRAALAPDASKRLSAVEVLESEWLQQGSFDLADEITNLHVDDKQDLEMSPEGEGSVLENPIPLDTNISDMPSEEAHASAVSPPYGKAEREPLKKRKREVHVRFRTPSPPPKEPTETPIMVNQKLEDAQLYHNNGLYHLQRGEYGKAEFDFREATIGYIEALPPWHPTTLESTHQLGIACQSMGNNEEAISFFQTAFCGRRDSLGTTAVATLESAYHLGHSYWNAGEYQKTEAIFQETLEAFKSTFGPRHERVYAVLALIGGALYQQGKLEEAKPILQRVVTWRQENLGESHSDTLHSMYALGDTLMFLGDYDEAQSMLEKVVLSLQSQAGPTNAFTVHAMYRLGLTMRYSGKNLEAAALLQEASDAFKALGMSKEIFCMDALFNWGLALWFLEDYKKAEGPLKESTRGFKAVFGLDERTAAMFYRLGRTQYKLKKFREARDTFREVVNSQESLLGPLHAKTLNATYWLGYSLRRMDRFKESKPLFQKAFEGQRQVLGLMDWDTLESLVAVANTHYSLKQWDEAHDTYRQVVDGWTEFYSPTHDDTLYALRRLGRSYHKAKKYREARKTLQLLVERHTSVSGTSASATLSATESLGWTLYRLKKYQEGETIGRDLVRRRKRKLKADAPKVLDAVRLLALQLDGQEKYAKAEPLFNEVVVGRRKALGRSDKKTLQSEKELERCRSRMETSDDDANSVSTLTSVDSDPFSEVEEARLSRARGFD